MPLTRAHAPGARSRRLPITLLLVALAALLCPFATACAAGSSSGGGASGTATAGGSASSVPTPASRPSAGPPEVRAWTGIMVVRKTGEVLWRKDPDRELPQASLTKIMTALLTLEHVKDLDEWATVPDIPIPQKVGVDLMPGDRITVREALYALLLESANDAALTLAAHVAGDETKFVALMNRRAKQLGLKHTHYANSRGAPDDDLYSTARDCATLARYAMRDPDFRKVVSTRSHVVRYPPDAAILVHNHNRLLQEYDWADGVKTGSNAVSGKVLAGSGKPGKVALIVVTMHQRTRDEEVEDAVKLFKWGTAEYLRRKAAKASPGASASP